MLPEDLLADANGALQTLREVQRLIAPLAGAGLFSALGGGAVALIDAATFLAAAAALAFMRVDEPPPAARASRPLAEAMAGVAHLRATVPLRQLVLACAACLIALGLTETLVYAIVDDGLHRSPTFVGVLMATQGVGRRRRRDQRPRASPGAPAKGSSRAWAWRRSRSPPCS